MIEITSLPQIPILVSHKFSIAGTGDPIHEGKNIIVAIDNQFQIAGSRISNQGNWQVEMAFLNPGEHNIQIAIDTEKIDFNIQVINSNFHPNLRNLELSTKSEECSEEYIIGFYLGHHPDKEGRMIESIWLWDYAKLQSTHNYIQWLFPLRERSKFNRSAPILTDSIIEIFNKNEHLKYRVLQSFKVLLEFYGLQCLDKDRKNINIFKSGAYLERKVLWISQRNHNYLRITRILASLSILGLEKYANSLLRCLEVIYEEEAQNIGNETYNYWKNAVKSNSKINPELEDKIRGTIYGQAIGDALGLGTEFLLKHQIAAYYPQGLRRYNQIIRDKHRSKWICGDWTDDTDEMLCILDSILEKKQVDLIDISYRFKQWLNGNNPGISKVTYSVLSSPMFLGPGFDTDPYAIAKRIWEKSNKESAANGGIMRTSVLGIWEYAFPEKVIDNAEKVCKLTHYDPRCVGSSVAVSLAISALLRGEKNISALIQSVYNQVLAYDSRLKEYFELATNPSISALNLWGVYKIGYTLKAMGAGFWALQHATSYEHGLLAIINEGGDADTNASVAGALLGAKFGYSNIPQEWIEDLLYKQELDTKVEQFISLVS